jgi:DNA-directed RNA polymerase subunit A'
MQRRLINALEDLRVEEDSTVRNTAGTVIQYRYGEDSVDPSRSVQGKALIVDEVLNQVLGKRYRPEEYLRGEALEGTLPGGEEELDLLAEAQLEEENEDEESEEPSGEGGEGPDMGGGD